MRITMCVAAGVLLMMMTGVVAPAGAASSRLLEGVVNVNAASPEQLRLLSGIGPAKIRNILAYRRAHPFRTVDELVRIKGIGRKMVRRLRMHLATSGPTTAQIVIRPPSEPSPEAGGGIPESLVPPPSIARPPSPPSRPARKAVPGPLPPPLLRRPVSVAPGGTMAGVPAARRGVAARPPAPVPFPRAAANHCLPSR